jgi:hypothetical protein
MNKLVEELTVVTERLKVITKEMVVNEEDMDARSFDYEEGIVISGNDALLIIEAQQALQEHAANKEGWVRVGDRLPEDDKDYQVWEKGAIIATAAHYNTKEYFLKEYDDENYMEEG